MTLPEDFPRNQFYNNKDIQKIDDYSAKTIIKKEELKKTELCEWICKEVPSTKQKIYLKEFNKILDAIKEIINK